MDSLTLKRYDLFQNLINGNCTHAFAPALLILKIQKVFQPQWNLHDLKFAKIWPGDNNFA